MVSEYKLTRVGLNGILSKNYCGIVGNGQIDEGD